VVAEILEPATCHGDLPFLSERDFAGALRLPRSGRLAVTALLSGYLGAARARGAEVWLNTEVQAVHTLGGRVCGIETSRGPAECRTLVCAAGPWASAIAELAGALPIQLVPLRRTLITVDPPLGMDVTAWPLVSYDSRGIYLVPEGRYLLASPMDEDPIAPCDASPVPAAVQLALDRLGRLAAPLRPPAIRAVRAGLRTFAPDRRPVVGEDPLVPGFFWLAGQGGAGIETSPAVGRLAAQLITRGEIPDPDLARALSPARFAG
jgi:D-arginine dehydrogenase